VTFLVCLLTALAAQAPAREQRPRVATAASVIYGRVLSDAGAPIRKARVTLAEEGKAAEREPVYTDLQGRFQFADVAPGRYTLAASKAGYVTTWTGARQPLEPAAPIAVGEKGIAASVDIRLPRAAAINGRIIDETGEPIAEAPVSASRMVRSAGRTRLITIVTTTTDDLGEYRLSGLAGGRYIVSVEPTTNMSEAMAIISVDASGNAVLGSAAPRWARVYYPAATSIGQAQPLSLRPGQEVSSIELTVRPRTVGRGMLTVVDANGVPESGMAILESTSSSQPLRVQQAFFEGKLPITVDPGEWDVVLDGRRGGVAATHVTVGESDFSGTVILGNAPQVSGRVLVDGAAPPATSAALVASVPDLPGAFPGYTAPLNRDGSFTFDRLLGTFDLRLRNAPPGWFIQSVSLGGRSLPDTTIRIAGPVNDVVVQVSARPSVLNGTVNSANGAPAAGISVLVFPKNAALLVNPTRWARWLKTDQSGRFTTGDIPAGEFYAIALADVDDSQWTTAEYLEPLRVRAVSVSLAPGERKTLTLTAENVQ
jgi:carboxypeptidase family protein